MAEAAPVPGAASPSRRRTVLALVFAPLLTLMPDDGRAQAPGDGLADQVRRTELAFAATMARRDHAGFVAFLSEQAVFIDGDGVSRGKVSVAAAWKPLFDGAAAPFSWAPDAVQVLDDGSLAHSSGLVRNPHGLAVARFNSIWRQESPGVWRIVFDKGSPLSVAERQAAAGALTAASGPTPGGNSAPTAAGDAAPK
jgi:ketosteroid isomerase-like protein